MEGYRRVEILDTKQVIDMAIPAAAALVNGGRARYLDEKENTKRSSAAASSGVQTAALNNNTQTAARAKATLRNSGPTR